MAPTTITCSAARSPSSNRVVLIVEYHAWLRLVLANVFGKSGFEVHFASNGAAGLRLAARLTPDLVVVGDSLPELPPEQLIIELEIRRAVTRTRVVRTRDLLQRESHRRCSIVHTATTAGDRDICLMAGARPSPERRHNTRITRERCRINPR